ncbi:MAG: hypothetical protein WD342_20295 [Verrucomicrobiales bacterium]
MAAGTRFGKWMFFGVIVVIAIWFVGALVMSWLAQYRARDRPGRAFSDKVIGETLHPVTIRQPSAGPWVDSGKKDEKGQPVIISCATCHDTRDPDFKTNEAALLDEFHQGMAYQHGSLSCMSCHHPEDYNSLKLADDRRVDFAQSMQLCAQCHGPQHRDYQNGSHGGMTGYWDLRQGPRERNHCIDCHDPHHPKYPRLMPVFPPKREIGEAVPPPHEESNY